MDPMQKDFVVACWLMAMAMDEPPTPETAKQTCEDRWIKNISDADRQTLCVQAKLDDNNWDARCATWEAASAFCTANGADPCAEASCAAYGGEADVTPPPVDERPWGWQDTCNELRPPTASVPLSGKCPRPPKAGKGK
jgi:hypothetical protein